MNQIGRPMGFDPPTALDYGRHGCGLAIGGQNRTPDAAGMNTPRAVLDTGLDTDGQYATNSLKRLASPTGFEPVLPP